MLSDTQVKELWSQARPFTGWASWSTDFLALLEGVAALSDEEFSRPETQARLWSAEAVARLGPAGEVRVEGACSDPDVLRALLALRRRAWPESPTERARALDDAREQLLALVSPRHGPRRPEARLDRLLAVLLPAEGHCVLEYRARGQLAALLLPEGSAPSSVLVRDRLRRVLGPEQDLAEHMRRSLFCQWLLEHSETRQEVPLPHGPPPLTLWPPGRQFRDSVAVEHPVDICRELIQATLPGISRLDLMDELGTRDALKALPLLTRKALILRARGLGLLEEQGGQLRPTREGLELLEVDAPDILVRRMLERIHPLAALLRFLHAEPRREEELSPYEQTPEAPHANLAWLRALDLVETREGRLVLSAYGAAWEARLPREVPPMKPLAAGPRVDTSTWPGLSVLSQRFREDARTRDFVLDESQLAALHLAWHGNPQKRFVTLSGVSGTGKTSFIQNYARFYCEALGLPPARHFEAVTVSGEWRDATSVLGFCHARYEVPAFHVEPVLRFLLAAARNPSAPYFLLFEEMNAARADQYFAPFLSSMESGIPITLHGQHDYVDGVPPQLDWPLNLFIAGMVNQEEGTYTLSDKVFDRSFHLEFPAVDLPAFFAKRPGPRQPDCEQILQGFHDKMLLLRQNFGYRVAGDVLTFVEAAGAEASSEQKLGLLDRALLAKVLPRLRGDGNSEIRSVLTALRELCLQHSLKNCGEKLRQMDAAFQRMGFTRF